MAASKVKCFRCKNLFVENDFYSVSNGIVDKMHICKECCTEIVDEHIKNGDSIYEALYKLCAVTGILYNKALASGVIAAAVEKDRTTRNVLNSYFKALYTLPQYKNKSFLDSDFSTVEELMNDPDTMALIQNQSADIVKWGQGFSREDYQRLNALYAQWASGTSQDTITQKSLTKDLCKIDLRLEKAAVKGADIKDLLNQKQSLIKELAIDPQTLLKNRQDNEAIESFGAWVAEIEKTSPAEYIENPEIYFDVNGIESYWDKHIKRPLKNLLLGTKDFPNVIDDDN